ncbi:hypothetical protein L1049_002075 [Liquidambar formosana]|uniref:Histone-lysine N-methyltransferase, H3 lysine-9 specific SUVH4 n=1 Tax=Liquidambar formosana TaxID=63359 RepID=A0AAP0NE86_LIQFO
MVVQSLQCVNSIQNPISGGELDRQVDGGDQHLTVSHVSPAEKRAKCNIVIKYGKKSVKIDGDDSNKVSEKATPEKRRVSARIQIKMKNEKLRLLSQRAELLDDVENGSSRKKTKVYHRRNGKIPKVGEEVVGQKEAVALPVTIGSKEATDCVGVKGVESTSLGLQEVAAGSGTAGESTSGIVVEKSAHAMVKETLRTFNKYYLHLVQEEETRCKKVEVDRKTAKGSKFKKGDAHKDDLKQSAKRPDLKAISKMIETDAILHPKKRFGPIPGIDVGHQFFSRAEMVVTGFHSHWLNGIDYMGQSYKKGEYSSYTFPLAVAIVLSGVYEDDLDNSDDVVYTGQGGNNLLGNKRQVRDQVLERGNLALKNCLEQNVPVRVVRGHKSSSSYVGKVYTYDGLLLNIGQEKGVSGYTVFKYRLRRLEGQPILTTNQVQYARGRVPQAVSEIRGLVCEDITGGQEDIPIPATNLVDDPPGPPTGYTYCKSIQVSESVKLPTNTIGCNCKGTCIDSKTCSCAKLNGFDFPYVHRNGGRLIEAKDVVFECGPKCGCGPDCINRTSQRGLKYRLEVFRTPKKGWAVRSWDYIPSGAPVCEYTGILMRTDELDNASENNYIFDIDCLQTMKGLDGRERRLRDVSVPVSHYVDKPDDHKSDVPEFCIDAGSTGNIARFINHSCEPNLFVQCVLSSHYDVKLAQVMLFAADNIPPLQELTYDYGYALDSVLGPDGKIRQMPCYCGAAGCRKRLL